MTLPVAPSSISFNQINVELFGPTAAPNLLQINDQAARCLACLPTPNTPISLSSFYGKTAGISTLATCYCGGWYMGCTTSGPATYYMLVAPVSSLRWDSARSGTPCACGDVPLFALSTSDGYCIQKCIQAAPTFTTPTNPGTYSYPAFNYFNGLSLNGYSDWYIPSVNEMTTIYCNADRAWTCGGPMKSSGNAFPICGGSVCSCPASPYAPGCWPYLGYTTGITAPGAASALAFGCNSGWIPGNASSICYPTCGLNGLCHTTANQACVIPTSPTRFSAMASLNLGFRFLCTQGWPNTCTCWGTLGVAKCNPAPNNSQFRAVRREPV